MANFFDIKARAARAKAEAQGSSSTTNALNGADQTQQNKPWVEKYRPRTLEDVKSQDHATMVLRRMVSASNLPHLLCYGPPGNGKTSAVLALARDLFGPELFPSRVLELNASDDRGISVVREKVRGFAAQALTNAPVSQEYRSRYPCPPFRLILLDEADNLSADAQNALRRVMEIYSKGCRFALICNYVTRIIDPISSRCAKFRFKAMAGVDAQERIAFILKNEGVGYDDGVIEATLKIADGDLRRALQLLQSCSKLVGAGSSSSTNWHRPRKGVVDDDDEDTEMTDAEPSKPRPAGKITLSILDEIAGVVPASTISTLLSVMRKGPVSNFPTIQKEVTDIVASGYSANEVLLSLYSKLMFDDMVASSKKNKMALIFSEKDKLLVDGANEELQMSDLCCQLAEVLAR